MLKIWFKIFFRNGQKNWLNISINIIGLTVYFAQLLLVLLSFNGEQSKNENIGNANEMYSLIHKMSDGDIWDSSTKVEDLKYKEYIPEILYFYSTDVDTQSAVVKKGGRQLCLEGILKGILISLMFFLLDYRS
jgi:putative ABC transport system permease protein